VRLKYRLSLLFIVVIAVAAAASLILVRRSTESMFRSFVFSGDSRKAKAYATILSDYYAANGSWGEAQGFLIEMPRLLTETIDTMIRGQGSWPSMMGNPAPTLRSLIEDRVVVADSRGIIVADTANQIVGSVHPVWHLDHGVPVINNFQRTGTVLVGSMIDSSLSGVDERFLESVTRSIIWSTAAAAFIALSVGLVFTSRITRPLGVLAQAARRVASGDLSEPVSVVGRDEVADLSSSFNEMTAELRRLDAAKKQVIADSAHELRTPLTLIQGIVEGMMDGVFPRDDMTLESVYEETKRLSRLIDTLRELEIIESGELELVREGVDLREAIQKALMLFTPGATAKSITLSLESEESPPPIVSGDYVRLGEVIYNLVSNAIKYTPEGGAVVVREHAILVDSVVFSVEDSGPGIELAERARIFERFYRIDKSRASETGGRGLGLAIAAEIIKAHKGSISVGDSNLGGACFTVTLPLFSA